MSGEIHGPVAALMTPEQASKLLDEVVYERVVGCIDFDALFQFEQELWHALYECGLDDEGVIQATDQLIERALARAGTDPRRHCSDETYAEVLADCELRDKLARDAERDKKRSTS